MAGQHGVGPAAAAGAVSALAALAVGELVGALVGASPLKAVGDGVIDAAPPPLKDFAVAAFGTADKPVLLAGIVVVSLLAGAVLGLAARRSRSAAAGGLVLFGALGLAAGLADPLAAPAAAAVSVVAAVAAGVAVLVALMARWDRAWPSWGRGDDPAGTQRQRRDFLRLTGATGVLAVTGGALARALPGGGTTSAARDAITLPRPARAAPPRPAGLDVPGLTPLYVPNTDFYRIDTALFVPRVAVEGWSLRIGGPLATTEQTYTFDDLLAMDLVEADVTLSCVSNDVGGDLVGNARWLGVPLERLLAPAMPERLPPGSQVVGRSVDEFTAAFPVEALADGRTALVAVGMNGEPLPARHGFPARLVVSGLYGYVSATKWLSSLELHDADFSGYWIPRGWAKEGPVKTQSRIDVPRPATRVPAGRVAVAGVAWAPARGIERVEVRVDEGDWHDAALSEPIGPDGWRQWSWPWEATTGSHRLQVRAIDGRGRTQTARPAPPRPDGAAGWHTIQVTVT